MWFKNIRLYRFTKPFDLSPEALEEKLAAHRFQPCSKHDKAKYGWVTPLGRHGEMLTPCDRQLYYDLRTETGKNPTLFSY